MGSHSQEGEEGEASGGAGFQHCFLTVTAVPSFGNCQDCIRVSAASKKSLFYWGI